MRLMSTAPAASGSRSSTSDEWAQPMSGTARASVSGSVRMSSSAEALRRFAALLPGLQLLENLGLPLGVFVRGDEPLLGQLLELLEPLLHRRLGRRRLGLGRRIHEAYGDRGQCHHAAIARRRALDPEDGVGAGLRGALGGHPQRRFIGAPSLDADTAEPVPLNGG